MKNALIKSCISPDATVHTFRSSFVKNMIEAGAGIRNVQEYLGHSEL